MGDVRQMDGQRDGPLFSTTTRRKLEGALRDGASDPAAAVTTVEQVLCAHIVASLRGVLAKWAHRGGQAFAKALAG
jgi:hypothetical protein